MTKEEALKVLDTIPTIGEQVDALEMAIEALEREPCEDCISRQAVLGIVSGYAERFNDYINSPNDSEVYAYARGLILSIERNINDLPSVTPQPKIGRWIEVIDKIDRLGNKTWHHECSICGNEDSGWGEYKYCPNCGARMEVKE